jgi:subtilisin family serine protease
MLKRQRWAVVGAVLVGLVMPAAASAPTSAQEAPEPAKPDLPDVPVVESTTGSYVVVMTDDPLLADLARDDLDTAVAEAAADAIVASHDEVLAEEGISTDERIQSFTVAANGFAATLTYDQAVTLSSNPKVAMVLPDELQQPHTDASGEYLGLAVRGGAWDTGLTGEGVIVGVIDSGIWPEHPSFADDGTYPPAPDLPEALVDGTPSSSCDFGNSAHNPNDAPFTCNNKLIGARQVLTTYRAVLGADPDEFDSARDDDGHGTHTASTAAGNAGVEAEIFGEEFGEISGIAPRARVIAYKGLGNLGGFSSDLAAAIDQAVADGVDVINYSVGGGPGLVGADTISFLFAADAGVFVATSAGNSGDQPFTIGGPADLPWVTTVAASTQERFFQGTITLSNGDEPQRPRRGNFFAILQWIQQWRAWQKSISVELGASVTRGTDGSIDLVDAANAALPGTTGSDLCLAGTLDPAKVAGKVVLCRRGGNGRVAKSETVHLAGGEGMILYNNSDSDNLFTDNFWVPTVHVDLTEGEATKAYIAAHADPQARIHRTGKETEIDYDPSITIFSSRGPNPSSQDIIKPDITAPGLQILAGNSPFPDPDQVPGELFQAIAGTSMSSPHVAGLFALLKQAHPDWTPAMAKSAMMTTADPKVRDNDRVSRADPFDTGSGHVRPGRVSRANSMFNPGVVYDAGFVDYLSFLCSAADFCFAPPVPAKDLNYPSIAMSQVAGAETVTRTITSVADRTLTWRAQVEAPAGYAVTVEPSSATLAPGESLTFTVTAANTGAGAIDEWAFGALTWTARGGYAARSPIAVQGTLFGAPGEVVGAGADGSVTFDVGFGYTGSYSAAPHGLSPNTPHVGEVAQDVDQTPFTEDDGAGLVAVPVAVTGTALARWEMFSDNPNVDIDLYLVDPNGDLVAQSTSGGTAEQIDVLLPADGEYTLFIHGWAVGDTPFAYQLDQWLVPLAAGTGNLTVTAAPTAGNIGDVAQVTASWTGAAAGRSLGAVSHTGPDGLLGLTVVAVDN